MKNYLQKNNSFTFNDIFDDFFKPTFFDSSFKTMRTDIKNTDTGYELEIEMPGVDKKEVNLSLENGYLTVSYEKEVKSDENYVKRERYASFKRSYYVGDVDKSLIKANLQNGVLNVSIPNARKENFNIEID
ncbi:MAG: Hsp20/alpha crystallin family protein [Clostridiales bacterium]|nr:Hsp20/alpha crystallin family protein [Clostridiales bacterium]